jgi:hypothetical protein
MGMLALPPRPNVPSSRKASSPSSQAADQLDPREFYLEVLDPGFIGTVDAYKESLGPGF